MSRKLLKKMKQKSFIDIFSLLFDTNDQFQEYWSSPPNILYKVY